MITDRAKQVMENIGHWQGIRSEADTMILQYENELETIAAESLNIPLMEVVFGADCKESPIGFHVYDLRYSTQGYVCVCCHEPCA